MVPRLLMVCLLVAGVLTSWVHCSGPEATPISSKDREEEDTAASSGEQPPHGRGVGDGGDGDTGGQVGHHQVTEQLDEGDQAIVQQSKKDETYRVIEKQGESLRGDQDSRKQDRNLHGRQQDGNDHEVLNQQRPSQPKMSQQRTHNNGKRDQDTGTGNQDTGQEDQDTGLEDEDTKEGAQGNQERDQATEGKDQEEKCAANNPSDCTSPDPFPPEEDEPNYEEYVAGVDLIYSIDPSDKARGYELLSAAALAGNNRALETLAYGCIFGSYLTRNFTKAFEIFSELAEKGSPIGQQGLAFMYSIGIGVNSNQAKAVINYVFAALGGHQLAQMAMGYRAHMGVGVVQSCEGALAYYQKSADEVIRKSSMAAADIVVSKVRLMDEDDETPSIYGVSEDEMLHYQSLFTDSGNTRAQFTLGIYYMLGLAGARRSYQMALKFLSQASENRFPAAYILMGKIYAEGSEDVPQDYEMAYENFKAAAELKYGDGYCGLGWLYFKGLGVHQDKRKAIDLFQKAADKGSAEGHYYLGMIYFNGDGTRKDIGKGIKYLQLACHGDHMHALHLLGTINAAGTGVKRSCGFAVELLKSVSERGMFTRMFSEARRLYTIGDTDSSFLMYSLLAELGFEEAQSNAAYLLEQGDLTFIDNTQEQLKRALLLWNRAAAQGYHQARVKLGDYYYYGLGTEVSYEAAATQYRMASDKQGASQAMFNLGYMYEHGEGLEKDYHLAKRYYDLAAETSSEAVVPASMALFKLNVMYTIDHYREWLDFQSMLGGKWDLYLMSFLAGLVVLLIIWRTRH